MIGPNEIAPVSQLVLARLLVSGEKGATVSEVRKALEPVVGHRWAGASLSDRLADALAGLASSGSIVRARKGKTERATLTPDGRRRALEILGVEDLPPKTTWDKVRKTYLTARALGLPAPEGEVARRFAGDVGFKAALLKSQFGLPLPNYPKKVEEAIDALAWTLLGFTPGRKFDVKSVQAALIHRAMGEAPGLGPKPDPKAEASKLLAKELGARPSGKDELRLAVLRRWIDGRPLAPEAPAPEPEPERLPAPAPDLDRFARRVREAALASPSGRFGAGKVFVVHVWRALESDPEFAGMGLDGFKRRLAEANNARRIELARADLVEAMDPEDVRLSEVPYLGATFHFIRL